MQAFHVLLHATPNFSGQIDEDITRWLGSIERIALPLGCTDGEKLAVAYARLLGSALQFSEVNTFPTWVSFSQAITLRFGDDHYESLRYLNKCRQTAYEPVKDYIDRFRMLAARTGKIDTEDLVDKFLKGLTPMLYDRVIICGPTSLDQAMEKSIYFEQQLNRTGKSLTKA